MKTFEELGVSPEIRKAIEEMGYENPMPVQEEVIPYLLGNGNDVVALAQTGTGKTAAFGLPLIQKIDVSRRVPQALILCPTRELCLQIAGDLTDYSKYITDLKILPVYGGSSIESQIKSLKAGVHIIVATPGRLIDLMERKVARLDTVADVVMDEADEMLNMGFTDSINAILEKVPEERNTLMFSATMSPEIARIAKTYLHDAKEITIGTKNEGSKNVHHIAYTVHAKDKYLALKRVVDFYPQIYGIIFCRTRKETQEIADKLIQDGYNADALHGELSQAQRDLVMQKFRQRHLQLLVATDVAARGLDVNDLTHVINYGLPDDTESYTHRSGRTGRAGKTGVSIAIINLREKGKMREIERIIKKKFDLGTLPTGKEICEQQLIKLIDDIEKVKVDEEEIETFLPGIYRKLEWLSKEDLIKRVVSMEFNRFLDYYKNAAEIEQPKGNEKRESQKERKDHGSDREKTSRKAEKGYTRLFLNLGKTDGFYANQIIELINRNLKKERIEIGRIDLMQNFSFFEIAEAQAPMVIKALNKTTANGRRVIVEVAGENNGKSDKSGKKQKNATAKPAEKKGKKGSKADKSTAGTRPSREERGYTSPRGPKKKDDWKQFFVHDDRPLKGEEPDFMAEQWAKPMKRKK
ncbi:DEAD/DEAH box helicase [Phocaeicola coprophilus]|jgi:ATP-dependent RNA helicase DeaD|uniref:DEAD/DEAH box helicase n=1 Tax=Phocaeicola TaxID=909656 RepID=UPI00266C0077|nr:DEAD/DEAH box helicase [Phocaeicola coprophilus]